MDIIIIIFFFFTFWSEITDVSFFGPLPWTLNASPNNTDHTGPWNSTYPSPVMTSIPIFFWQFYWYFSFSIATLSTFGNPIWSPTIPHFFPIFFPDFSLFYRYFSFSIATLSIFGSVRWTLNTQCPTWSPTIPHFFPYFFLIFFCYFIAIFHSA